MTAKDLESAALTPGLMLTTATIFRTLAQTGVFEPESQW
jgi:hypothetical protein